MNLFSSSFYFFCFIGFVFMQNKCIYEPKETTKYVDDNSITIKFFVPFSFNRNCSEEDKHNLTINFNKKHYLIFNNTGWFYDNNTRSSVISLIGNNDTLWKYGWNTIFFRKDSWPKTKYTLQNEESKTIIEVVPLSHYDYNIKVLGLYSLVDCDTDERIFKIPKFSSMMIPLEFQNNRTQLRVKCGSCNTEILIGIRIYHQIRVPCIDITTQTLKFNCSNSDSSLAINSIYNVTASLFDQQDYCECDHYGQRIIEVVNLHNYHEIEIELRDLAKLELASDCLPRPPSLVENRAVVGMCNIMVIMYVVGAIVLALGFIGILIYKHLESPKKRKNAIAKDAKVSLKKTKGADGRQLSRNSSEKYEMQNSMYQPFERRTNELDKENEENSQYINYVEYEDKYTDVQSSNYVNMDRDK